MANPGLSNPYQDSIEIHIEHTMVKQLQFNHLPDMPAFSVKTGSELPEQYRISGS
jgi:hypothetical protein